MRQHSPRWHSAVHRWADQQFPLVQGRIGQLPDSVTHLYFDRTRYLADHALDPATI